MIQKLSTRQASLESRQALLVQIASENGIPLHLKDDASDITKVGKQVAQEQQKRLIN